MLTKKELAILDNQPIQRREMRLYELTDEYNTIAQLLGDSETNQETLTSQLISIQEEFSTKAENIGKLVLSLASENSVIQTEIERLSSRKQSLDKKIDWLKAYLLQEMITINTRIIKGQVLTISLRDKPPSVNIVNQDLIPQEYRRVIPESWQPDKIKILTTFRTNGEIVAGVDIIRDKKTILIK